MARRNLALGEVLLRDAEDDELPAKDRDTFKVERSLAQVLAKYESGQMGQGFGGNVAAGTATRFSADPNADNRPSRSTEPKAGRETAPSVASADLGSSMRPGNLGFGQNVRTGWKSFQMVLESPQEPRQSEAVDQAEAAAEKRPAVTLNAQSANAVADQVAEPAEVPADAKKEAAPKPIRTLFIFRSLPQPATK
jgi:hypothetical protein